MFEILPCEKMKPNNNINFTELNVNRIQALTDAVFAIVITILSLTLVVPPGEDDEGLKRFMWDQIIPKLFIFFLGFIIVGAFWVDTCLLYTSDAADE